LEYSQERVPLVEEFRVGIREDCSTWMYRPAEFWA
jgi:hypothetical protein